MIKVSPLSKKTLTTIQAKIDGKTKPLGALGALEPLALQLALICQQRQQGKLNPANNDLADNSNDKISINMPSMLVFAGDHGINDEQLSIAPSAVTKQMVLNFLHGGAAINCFCQSNDIALTVIDCGILLSVNHNEIPAAIDDKNSRLKFIEQRLGAGTDNFATGPAMSLSQVKQGFAKAQSLVNEHVAQGVELLLLGEMGIANTSAAAALMSALTSFNVEQCVGRGTGITDEQLKRKLALIEQALLRAPVVEQDTSKQDAELSEEQVMQCLAEFGGFEIVQMVSAILSGAAANIPVVIDGFIVSVAALVALRLDKNVANYLIFSHVSEEKAHQLLLNELMAAQTFTSHNAQPLLNLGLRLGEGTGGALALPLIKASASFYNHMASFESAGVTV